MTLTAADIEAIAEAVVAKLRAAPTEDPLLNSKEACLYLGMCRTTLHELRKTEALLKPTTSTPLRWSKRQLETFKLSKAGAVMRAAVTITG